MVVMRTDLGTTRESARRIRVEPTAAIGGTISSTNVQKALEELNGDITGLAGVLRVVTGPGVVVVSSSEGGVAINKAVGAATAVTLPAAASRAGLPVTVKDMKGDANANNITVTPAGGETIDGFATDVLDINGAARTYRPIAGGWLIT